MVSEEGASGCAPKGRLLLKSQGGGVAGGAGAAAAASKRGPFKGITKVLFVGTVTFIGISLYFLVVTHHLHLPDALARLAHVGPQGGVGLVRQRDHSKIDTHAPGAAFAASMLKIGTFEKYDRDRDGHMGYDEFHHFLLDLGKSQILDDKTKSAISSGGGTAAVAAAHDALEGRKMEEEEKGPPAAASAAASASAAAATTTSAAAPAAAPAVAVAKVETGGGGAATKVETGGGGGVVAKRMCPELSRELVASFAKENTIMLAVCDWRMFETFGINWMKHLKELGVDNYLVGSTDRQTAEFLSGQGNHPCFKYFEEGAEEKMQKEYKFGDVHYIEAVWRKVSVVERIVDWGFNVLQSDVDVVWFRDPLPYFLGRHCKDVDFAVSTDLVSTQNGEGDEGLEMSVHKQINVNTGVYFVKSTFGGRHIMKKWVALREVMKHENDQIGMYRLLRNHKAKEQRDKRRLYYPDMDGAPTSVGLLSVGMLLNGYSYFIPRLHEAMKVEPLGVHMTWLPLCREGKYHRMRDGMLYHDPPAYYTEPMFITADIEFPVTPDNYNNWVDTEKMIMTHVQLMEKQLVQVYRVMAIAIILNRTLVLPTLQCYCYKNWFMSEQCRIPGDRVTKFPMECALDQWLRPKVMYNYGNNIIGEDGPRSLLFREYTMLQNERFPEELRSKELTVQAATTTCSGDECSMINITRTTEREVAFVPRGLSQKQIVRVFEPLKNEKLIRLKGAMEMFSGFDDLKLKASFETFLDKVAVNWCCREPKAIAKGMKEKEKLAIHW